MVYVKICLGRLVFDKIVIRSSVRERLASELREICVESVHSNINVIRVIFDVVFVTTGITGQEFIFGLFVH